MSPAIPTLADRIEAMLPRLIEDDDFRRLIEARSNAEAAEGSLIADDTMAAMRIRNEALKQGDGELGRAKAAEVIKALGVALRRYGMSRSQRRDK